MSGDKSGAGRRVVFVNRFYWPDHSATAQILTDLAVDLAAHGWDVSVIASRLRYDGGERLPAREVHAGVTIVRVATTGFGRAGLLGRAADYASFYLTATWRALRLLRRGDVVVVKTDPPLLQVPLALVARLRGARLVGWMQDVYPELAVALGVGPLRGWPSRALASLRASAMRSARRTVAIGSRMREMLAEAGAPAETLAEIHNWADDAVLASDPGAPSLRIGWGFAPERLVVGYSGNLGRAHELDTVLDAARTLAAAGDPVDFLFVGGGALRDALEREALPNVHLRPYQSREDLPRSLATPDIHWLSLRPEVEGLIVPSKFYGAAASGRPMLFIGASDGEVARLIRRYECGWTVDVGASDELARLLRGLASDRSQLAGPGANARQMVAENFSRSVALAQWRDLIAGVAADG